MANTFNIKGISPLFGFRILKVYYIMVRKGIHLIVYFIEVGQFKLLSGRSIYFLEEVLYTLASICFIRCSINIEFPLLKQCIIIDIFQQGFSI